MRIVPQGGIDGSPSDCPLSVIHTDLMSSPISCKKQSGMALVIVLCFLVIISTLIVAFFATVTTDLASTKSYTAGVTAKQLSDMATNLVMAQIRDATRGYQNPDDPGSGVLSWASQPGMVRTFDETGNPYAFYKLYSSGNMVLRSMSPQLNVNDEFDRDVPTDWATEAGVYTDLNAPVIVPDANGLIQLNGSNFRADYPILDPSAASNPAVEGFTIGGRLGPTSVSNPAILPNPNPAALPCRWLYVLKDGSMISPSNSANGKVTFENSAVKPDASNPIVGRVAFWADDESSKVNVNTAGEGTFWDIPRSTNAVETAFAYNMPAQNEFQRQPGHPGMTCLSTVFENLSSYWSLTAKGGSYATAVQHYMDFAPRLEFGGSQGGTVAVTGSTAAVANDHDRLFASLDELAFDVRYKGGVKPPPPPPGRIPDPNISRADLEKLRFFLTANSRAPETNLFNLPRICLWPIQKDTQFRTAKEQLIAFCTSTGTSASGNSANYYPYYFQRQSVFSGDARTLTMPAPSAASSWEDFALSTSAPVATNSTTSRNAVLYNYLQRLTSKNIPGFGGNFQYKYDGYPHLPPGYSDRDQILTEIYDMNRAAINTYTSGSNVGYNYAQAHPLTAESQVVPAVVTPLGKMNTTNQDASVTKGFGRFLTIPEVAVIFFSPPADPNYPLPNGMRIVKAAVVVGFFNATPSPVTWSPHMRVGIKGLSQFRVSGQSLNLPDVNQVGAALPCNFMTGRCGLNGPNGGGNHGAATHGLLVQFQHATGNASDAPKSPGNDGTDSTFPFVTLPPYPGAPNGGAAVIPISGGTMNFSGGTIQIQIFAGYETVAPGQMPKQLIQTLNVKFPGCTCPIPDPELDDFGARMARGNSFIEGWPNGDNTDLVYGDVVRSMQVPPNNPRGGTPNAAMGDLRILAAIPVVPTQMFQPHPDYNTPGKHAAHNLRTGGGGGVPPVGWAPSPSPSSLQTGKNAPADSGFGYYMGGNPKSTTSGNAGESALVPNQNKWKPEPVAAPGQTSAATVAGPVGDFDNGYGSFEDGAYINKPDEASAANPGAALLNGRGGLYPETGSTYSPNRQVSSAVLFGSLPSGVKATEAALYGIMPITAGRPWQTLLFCANPAAGDSHPGFGKSTNLAPAPHTPPYTTPPDHLWLDLFTMPVVEPYAISEPFSTAGKVNLNYQIAPFRHITRSTAVRAVMKGVQILGIPSADPDRKGGVRYPIEVEPANGGTLVGFENIFSRGDIFRSASQICDISLVPKNAGATYGGMYSWWGKNMHTGDNSRELPYGRIYPCVTTKSNVFTVHMRVQVLQKASGAQANPATWDETKDRVLSEYRGSNIVERYIDASDPTLPDFAASSPAPPPLDSYYKFRVVSTKRFCP